MITPKLENAILNGWASYKRVAHAFGSFGAIPIPKGSTVIITDIKWFPFLDPIPFANPATNTWTRLFKFNEYQLKVESKISKNFMQFRNQFKWKWFPNDSVTTPAVTNLDSIVDTALLTKFFLPEQGEPIIEDVYFVCEKFIKLSITRNAFIENFVEIVATLQPEANENNTPDGLKDANVLLRANMFSPSGQNFFYYPPTIAFAGNNIPTANRRTENYKQDYDKIFSVIQKISPLTTFLTSKFPYHCTPLVEIGYVEINSAFFDGIKNS